MSVEGVHTMFIPGVVSCDPKGGGGAIDVPPRILQELPRYFPP